MLGQLLGEAVDAAGVGDVAGVVPGPASLAHCLAAGVGHLHPGVPPSPPLAPTSSQKKMYKGQVNFFYLLALIMSIFDSEWA